jgi:hypothetical protein
VTSFRPHDPSFVTSRWSLITRHWPFLLILIIYLALAISYSMISPIYEPTDELRHFRYVRHLIVYRSLPIQQATGPRAQSHHPPLYYTLGALASWWVPVEQDVYYEPVTNRYWGYQYWEVGDDNKNQYLHSSDEHFPFTGVTLAVHVVRWMTILIGVCTVWLTYRIGHEVYPNQLPLALTGTAIVAFNPQFIYLSGSINNDIAAGLFGAAVSLACARMIRQGPSLRTDVTLGILYGLALLVKFHLLALLAPIGLSYVIAAWPSRAAKSGTAPSPTTFDWFTLLRGLCITLGLAALLSGWWFWRNYALYGDPTGMRKVNELWAGRPASENLWAVRQSLPYLWSSLWGRFGYGQVPMPPAVYRIILALCLVALTGYLIPRRRLLPRAAWLLVATPLTFFAVVCYYILIQPAGPMGRFLFPALPAFALLLSAGLARFVPQPGDGEYSHRLAWRTSAVVSVAMATLAVYGLTGILAPASVQPRPLTQYEVENIPNPTDSTFSIPPDPEHPVARLVGYQVTQDTIEPGGTVNVVVYWKALTRTDQNYAVFVHLLSDVGTMVAQRDTYPGLGRYPTTVWRPGVTFVDTYRVQVPQTAYAPDSGFVQIGMYLPDGPRLLTAEGLDALRLAPVKIKAQPGEVPNPLNANFDNQATLVGYEMDRRVVRPGESVRLTLYWRARVPIVRDYRIFAHVLGVENQVWANADSPPTPPTSQWQPELIIQDVRNLKVGLTTPPDFYDIEVGMYPPGEGRLPVIAEDGHWYDNRILLSKIRVTVD